MRRYRPISLLELPSHVLHDHRDDDRRDDDRRDVRDDDDSAVPTLVRPRPACSRPTFPTLPDDAGDVDTTVYAASAVDELLAAAAGPDGDPWSIDVEWVDP